MKNEFGEHAGCQSCYHRDEQDECDDCEFGEMWWPHPDLETEFTEDAANSARVIPITLLKEAA